MARSLSSKPNVNPPDSDYPFGRIRDDNGSGNGTPVNELVYGDIHQFFAKLLDDAAIVPNEMPENEYSGYQYNEALFAYGHKNNTIDLNNVTRYGVYSIAQDVTNGPLGLGTFSQLIVTGIIGSQVHQRIIDIIHGAEWSRLYTGGVWYNWVQIKDAEYTFKINGWDFAAGGNRQFAHGLGASLPTLLTGVDVQILNNAGSISRPISYMFGATATQPEGWVEVDGTNVVLGVNTGGSFYGNPAYAGTGSNRGWVKIRKRFDVNI